MTTSADVARHAGLSRSSVSQILNGRDHLFAEDTIARVKASAAALGYRPSVAGRTLARGTSDIVITLIPDVTFNPRLQELVDIITEGLSRAGYTNLLRFVGSGDSLEDAILGLKPFGVVSLAPLTDAQRERVSARGVHLVIQPQAIQMSIDKAIGRLQARHLASVGYESVAAVLPIAAREQKFANPRESGLREWAEAHGMSVLPTLHVAFEQGSSEMELQKLPSGRIGLAAYNDETALAVVSAALFQGRAVPDELGVIGVDNSPVAHAMTPSITTVDYDIVFSGASIVDMLLGRIEFPVSDPAGEFEKRLSIVQGGTTGPCPGTHAGVE